MYILNLCYALPQFFTSKVNIHGSLYPDKWMLISKFFITIRNMFSKDSGDQKVFNPRDVKFNENLISFLHPNINKELQSEIEKAQTACGFGSVRRPDNIVITPTLFQPSQGEYANNSIVAKIVIHHVKIRDVYPWHIDSYPQVFVQLTNFVSLMFAI